MTDQPTTADLITASIAQAEITRASIDRIVVALDDCTCPECGWPTELRNAGVACTHCDWWWLV